MERREKVRERADLGPKPIDKAFAIGDRVRFYDNRKKYWNNFGTMSDLRTHGASKIQS